MVSFTIWEMVKADSNMKKWRKMGQYKVIEKCSGIVAAASSFEWLNRDNGSIITSGFDP